MYFCILQGFLWYFTSHDKGKGSRLSLLSWYVFFNLESCLKRYALLALSLHVLCLICHQRGVLLSHVMSELYFLFSRIELELPSSHYVRLAQVR